VILLNVRKNFYVRRRRPFAHSTLYVPSRADALAHARETPSTALGHPPGSTPRLLKLEEHRACEMLDLGFGRTVASEIEAPNMLVDLV
jgi:hypothetical protein